MKMKIAVVGSHGQIGQRLVALNAIPMECDILDKDQIKKEYDRVCPDIVINATGIGVDEAEKDYDKAVSINVWGHNKLCEVVGDRKVVLLSSEYVFDGVAGNYREDDDPAPINNYGMTKLAAEGVNALYYNKTIRLSRTFNRKIGSDIHRYISKITRGDAVDVPTFFVKNYVHTDFAARAIMHFAENYLDMPEMMHYGGEHPLSFYNLMCKISFGVLGSHGMVRPRDADDKGEVGRPHNCSFDLTLAKTFDVPIFPLGMSLDQYFNEALHA
jgi:dTDP-4-dehydrorhamnose reductase